MCNQSVGLIQQRIEYAGITTVSISLLREITEKIRPPRALFVPYPLGYPLGEPNNSELQTQDQIRKEGREEMARLRRASGKAARRDSRRQMRWGK